MGNQPIIILGAPRSGTNALRDCLVSLPNFITWPCDEINFIWRHHNLLYRVDELNKGHANPKVKRYIKRKFSELTKEKQNKIGKRKDFTVIEKTCANCLRVDFINSIFPSAKYIYIKREPLDAIYSIRERWSNKLSNNLFYLLKKARYIPKSDLIYYLILYGSYRLKRLFSQENILPIWGPKYDGIFEEKEKDPLYKITKQWIKCTQKAEKSLENLKKTGNLIAYIKYEELALNPFETLKDTLKTLGYDIPDEFILEASKNMHKNSIGKSNFKFSKKEHKLINDLLNLQS